MSATERAVIYVDAGSDMSSLNSLSSSASSRRSSTASPAQTTNNYVIKIQIGEETMFNPVRINVAASSTHHHRQLSRHPVEPGDESPLNSSGQSSPRSDMTPPPPSRLNPGNIGSLRFGSETSESDTESDVSSAEYHNNSSARLMRNPILLNTKKPLHSAAQFAMRELIEMGPGSIFPIPGHEDPALPLKPIAEVDGPVGTGTSSRLKSPAFESLKTNLNQSLKNVFSTQEKLSRMKITPILNKPKVNFSLSPEPPMTEYQIAKSKAQLTKCVGFVQQAQSMIQDQTSFHVNELNGEEWDTMEGDEDGKGKGTGHDSLTNFAGYKDIFSRTNREGPNQIMSDKGTIRGVKNRVRDGIATFLQSTDNKNFIEKERGRCVVYVTSMGVVRDTHQRCQQVKQILKTLLIKFDERDCYMNREIQDEIRDRLPADMIQKMKKKMALDSEHNWEDRKIGLLPSSSFQNVAGQAAPAHPVVPDFTKYISLPQVFIEGQYLGDADVIEKLNESGELRKILKPYKALTGNGTCDGCGGFRMMPCLVCNGSKKSVHRNHFTEEFVALKCMHCDENGLVRCGGCNPRV